MVPTSATSQPHQRRAPMVLLLLTLLMLWGGATPHIAPAAPEVPVPPLDARPFGINTHLATRFWEPQRVGEPAQLVADAGAGWAREDVHWFRIQPTPETWDWSFTDAAFAELLRRNIQIVGVIGHPPGWATDDPNDPSSGVTFSAPQPERFARFAAEVVRRYGAYIHHWEIWNEPDNPLFWKPAPDPAAYAALLRQSSQAIRAVDPSAKILFGGVDPLNLAFLTAAAARGAWDSCDIIAIHPYVSPTAPEPGNLAAAADGVRTLMASYGAKPIWATEIGWSSGPGDRDPQGTVNERQQADFLVRATLLLWRSGVERIFWYTLKDDPGNPYGLFGIAGGYGDYSRPKPAYGAFRSLSRQIGGASYVGMRDLFRRDTLIDFERPGFWKRGDQPNGTLTPTADVVRSGSGAARLSYRFATPGNDYVVFTRDRPTPIPGQPDALGLWVYGDGSGHALRVWLRDADGELLQYTLGGVGVAGWRMLKAPLDAPVQPWDRISQGGDGRLDFPASVAAIVLDDAPDSAIGSGTIYLDDLTAISGTEAYDIQLQRGAQSIDVLWAPEPVLASIRTSAPSGQVVRQDGAQTTATASQGRLTVQLGPSVQYVTHAR